MSVDTYLKRKNLSSYRASRAKDVDILLSERLASWAQSISISAKRFLFWTSFEVEVVPIHAHAPGVT